MEKNSLYCRWGAVAQPEKEDWGMGGETPSTPTLYPCLTVTFRSVDGGQGSWLLFELAVWPWVSHCALLCCSLTRFWLWLVLGPYTQVVMGPGVGLGGLVSVQSFSHSVVSNSLQPHGLQHSRLSCPSPTPGACSNSCLSSRWCHPTISSSVVSFSRLQSFPASGSFPVSQFFTSGGQRIRVWGLGRAWSVSPQGLDPVAGAMEGHGVGVTLAGGIIQCRSPLLWEPSVPMRGQLPHMSALPGFSFISVCWGGGLAVADSILEPSWPPVDIRGPWGRGTSAFAVGALLDRGQAKMPTCSCSSAPPWTAARQAPLPVGFSRQEHWSGLPCSPPGELPNAGIKPTCPASPLLAWGYFFLPPGHLGSPRCWLRPRNHSGVSELVALPRDVPTCILPEWPVPGCLLVPWRWMEEGPQIIILDEDRCGLGVCLPSGQGLSSESSPFFFMLFTTAWVFSPRQNCQHGALSLSSFKQAFLSFSLSMLCKLQSQLVTRHKILIWNMETLTPHGMLGQGGRNRCQWSRGGDRGGTTIYRISMCQAQCSMTYVYCLI